MTAKTNEPKFGELLLQGAREAAAYASGDETVIRKAKVTRPLTARYVHLQRPKRPSPARIREIRRALNFSQSVFSDLLSVSASTVRAWEQGQRLPDGPSLRLLEIADRDPGALIQVATQAPKRTARRAAPTKKASAKKKRRTASRR